MPSPLTKLLNLGRSYSMWVYQWGLACCAIEMGAAFGSPRYDVRSEEHTSELQSRL